MPRLSDLLSDKLKNRLFTETRKPPSVKCRNPAASPAEKAPPAPAPATVLPDFVALDVETTGLDFAHDRIIEIGAVKFTGGKPGAEYSSLVNPGVPLPAVITELTGITGDEVAAAPAFAAVAQKLLSFIGGLPICGHQVIFDLTFINKELERAGVKTAEPFGRQSLDTVLLSKIILQSGTRFSLKSVTDSLDVSLTNAHRALADAKASGEVAVLLIPKLSELPLNVRQTMAAAAPASFLKTLIFASLGSERPRVSIRTRQAGPQAPKLSVPDSPGPVDTGQIKKIFSKGGSLEKSLASFSPRASQRDMAVEVAEALNTRSILCAEAGTGTGKSLAYCIPASLWAVANKTRVVVASRTRNLQDQLMSRDLPLAAAIAGGSFRYSVLKGRANYLCLNRWEQLLRGEAGNLSIRERLAVLPLIPWVESTATGDIEEQNQFNPKWFQKVWSLISAESHSGGRQACEGKRCRFFKYCFLQLARQKALSSHILIINHALFFSEMGGDESFLGKIGSIIFDEAHHLESGGHRFLRVELDTNRVSLFLEQVNNLVQRIADVKGNNGLAGRGGALKSQLKRARKHATAFLDSITAWAQAKIPEAAGTAEYQIPVTHDDFAASIEAPAFANTLETIKDELHQLRQDLPADPRSSITLDRLRDEVPACQERASQLAADLSYLVAAQTEDHAFWAEGNVIKGWTKLCGVPLDVAGLLSSLWAGLPGAVVFTSATLSVARSADYFFNSVGLEPLKARTAVRFFPSPFTKDQCLAGAVKNAPDPDSREFPSYVASALGDLHAAHKKNILVLFTANSMLMDVYKRLKADTRIPRENILAQNVSGGRHALLEQFRQSQQMILLGTDSFWEGIDAPGEACEVVVIPRLPFPVPVHPLVMALSKKMDRLHGESFMSYAVPEAVIRFRQGCGRLIRTSVDRGALIVLDNRIINKGYGRQFTRSLDAHFVSWSDLPDMLCRVRDFFNGTSAGAGSSVSYVPFDEV
jgi:ATP-dependent DNA helicase DinG